MPAVDAYIELRINAWDALAGILLVLETGDLTNDFLEGGGLTRGDILLAVTLELRNRFVEPARTAFHVRC
jgi:myo-inositol-1(or 4)-monophosphatase